MKNNDACKACGQPLKQLAEGRTRKYCDADCRKRFYRHQGNGYATFLAKQGGVCAICGLHRPAVGKKIMALDHDHVTGELRGVLCYQCNSGLGMFQDDITLIERALAYLKAASHD